MRMLVKKMNHQTTSRYTLNDLFKCYPYKKDSGEVGRNYIKVSDFVNDHEFSITLKEWKEICTAICQVVADEIIQGKSIFVFNVGTFNMVKYKPRNLKWFEDFDHTNGYKTFIRWKKMHCYKFLRFYFSKTFRKNLRESLEKEFYLIHNYKHL